MLDSPIPVRNIFGLLAYAWEKRPEELAELDVQGLNASVPQQFLAELLLTQIRSLLRRGIQRTYVTLEESLREPRGRILLERALALGPQRPRTLPCEFDELSFDTPANRALRATVGALLFTKEINNHRELATGLRAVFRLMAEVPLVELHAIDLTRVAAPRAHHGYTLALDICRFIARQLLPAEGGAGLVFRDFRRNHREMARLFEGFLRGYLFLERTDVKIARGEKHISWANASGDTELLPTMRSDIFVESEKRVTIVDAKFFSKPLTRGYLGTQERLRSGHLYQLATYMVNQQAKERDARSVHGGIVYAQVDDKPLSARLRLGEHDVFVESVNLAETWEVICDAVRSLPIHGASHRAAPSAPWSEPSIRP